MAGRRPGLDDLAGRGFGGRDRLDKLLGGVRRRLLALHVEGLGSFPGGRGRRGGGRSGGLSLASPPFELPQPLFELRRLGFGRLHSPFGNLQHRVPLEQHPLDRGAVIAEELLAHLRSLIGHRGFPPRATGPAARINIGDLHKWVESGSRWDWGGPMPFPKLKKPMARQVSE